MPFSILDHVQKLEIVKETSSQYACVCPICGDTNLKIERTGKASGRYACYSNQCSTVAIRNAISPPENPNTNGNQKVTSKKPKKLAKPKLTLVKLSKPATDSPKPKQKVHPKHGKTLEFTYHYSATQWVTRIQWVDTSKPKGYDKTFYQWHKDGSKNIPGKGHKLWEPYKLQESLTAASGNALLVVEGESCVEACRQIGLAAITLQGSNWTTESVSNLAQILKSNGLTLIYYPDLDQAGEKKASIVRTTCEEHEVYCLVLDPLKIWKDCPEKGDIVNAIAAGVDVIAEIEKVITEPPKAEPPKAEPPKAEPLSRPKSQKRQVFETLRNRYGHRLQLNIMSKQVELDNEMLKPDYLYLSLLDDDIDCSKEFASDVFYYLAEKNKYHPVQNYLEKVYAQHKATGVLDNAASRYLGTNNPIYDVFVRKFAIAAVARVFKPGCKMDTALILQGHQGLKKSTFYNILAGDYFDDSLSPTTTDKDEKLKLHATWIMEWAELESVFSRKDISSVKAFLSSATDKFRPPFARTTESHPRHSVIVGTANTDDFLLDATGSRRFWIVPVNKIDTNSLQAERDLFWADAVACYCNGEQWWLTNEEQKQANEINSGYQMEDTWTEAISNFCKDREQISVQQVLAECINLELSKQGKAEQRRVADILRLLGYEKTHTRKGKVWKKGSHIVTDSSQQGVQRDLSSDLSKNISHNNDLPVVDCDLSGIDNILDGHDLVVTPEITAPQDFQPSVTYVTQNSSQNQKELESQNQDQISSLDKPLDTPFKIGDHVVDRISGTTGEIMDLKMYPSGDLKALIKTDLGKEFWDQADFWKSATDNDPFPIYPFGEAPLDTPLDMIERGDWVRLVTFPTNLHGLNMFDEQDRFEVCGIRNTRLMLSVNGTGEPFEWFLAGCRKIPTQLDPQTETKAAELLTTEESPLDPEAQNTGTLDISLDTPLDISLDTPLDISLDTPLDISLDTPLDISLDTPLDNETVISNKN